MPAYRESQVFSAIFLFALTSGLVERVNTLEMVQDLPPAGGFPNAIRYQRYLPQRGPSGLLIFLTVAGFMGYGWTWFSLSLKEKRFIF